MDRQQDLSEKRRKTPCKFDDGITYYEFEQLAKRIAKQFPRIKEVTLGNAEIFCKVESITGRSDWYFRVDFNNWGHVEGTYWCYTENNDSIVPERYSAVMQYLITKLLSEKGISLIDYDKIINEDEKVGTAYGLSYVAKENFWEKIFAKRRQIVFECNGDDLVGEHVYCIVALLKSMGFKNIKSYRKKDIGNDSNHYIYEVDHIAIKDASHIRKGDSFPSDVAITVYYHDKKEITLPYSSKYYKRKNYIAVGDEFVDMGFSKIYERKIEDLVTGWVTKNGSVEDVFVEVNGKEIQIEKGKRYKFDTPIIITYHTYKYL